MDKPPFIAVDIGNSRIKLGVFSRIPEMGPSGLPEPNSLLLLDGPDGDEAKQVELLGDWLTESAATNSPVVASSVHRGNFDWLSSLLGQAGHPQPLQALTSEQLPLQVATDSPAQTGMDRLAAATAGNTLRATDRAAIIVDMGTAITVDLLSPTGVFLGGTILPGTELAAQSLAEGTDALPNIDLGDAIPDAVGTNTESAMQAGLFWGAVGAIREIIERQSDRLESPPQVFLTGGPSPQYARLIGSPRYTVRHFPHLVLTGVALAISGADQ